MHDRYSTGISSVTDRNIVAAQYLAILQMVASVQHELGIIPDTDPSLAAAIGAVKVAQLVSDWQICETEVRHETAGFIKALRLQLPAPLRPLAYLGMTSSDLMDTAAAMQWKNVYRRRLVPDLDLLATVLFDRGGFRINTEKRRGRTHGRHAEPVTIGAQYRQASINLIDAKNELSRHYIPGKLSGPVGEYNKAVTKQVADKAAIPLDVSMDHYSTQIVNRRHYRRVAGDLIEVVAICEGLATLHRLSAIQGVDLFAEGFSTKQMGSSVMPYKRNPINSERICGLARVARGHYSALLETWSTGWWERDLTNSSVERVSWWDLIEITHRLVLDTTAVVLDGQWTPDLPADHQSPVDELIDRQLQGEDSEAVYREIQSRA